MYDIQNMKLIKTYNYFIPIAIINFLISFLLSGESQLLKNENETSINTTVNYYSAVSFTILLVWCSYFIFRKKIVSKKIILLHLIFITLVVVVIPFATLISYNLMPRMYEDFDKFNFFMFFERHTIAFIYVSIIVVLSLLFLVFNIKRKSD
jgi:hypothetical protein